ncbi:MAG: ATP-dependent sacrificial sulfur transferase LarE [Gemmatimonadales bacterium]|nr:ATP-dependent sacrificial sulfur transferase LarE [Gemmatimonadales bacterium]NIN12300.1 ATP-dependent sacrificial sulfur transferase LarE [Gemmatimonadales bacterium]NIN48838.1 ATP-dependent sacrificial sulfur transferase LarE [Gemmatimonadales bacterium]NIP06302.1 ATP-dependent sacrificial sulfur transferase LarE [Gemmatimonadales bacterium]NIR00674.1 ATP-dependent sacrificial sulfur transferase LarE [Gemmatimonadales bacterium]
MTAAAKLEGLIATFPSLLVGYSGGVDSALLAVVAQRVLGGRRAVAAMGISPSYPAVQREQALDVARQFDLNVVQIHTEEMTDPAYLANSTDRCYFCKRELWAKLSALARERGLAIVADGTNADDLTEHRPGLQAAAEHEIRSPLAEVGYSKADVRREARALGIPIWDKPAAPCLSSRVMYGLSITARRLAQVEQGEALLRAVGVEGDLRVRHRAQEARIEVAPSQFGRVRARAGHIGERLLALGFDRVTLDLRGYRRGSLLEAGELALELLAERT